MKEKKRKGNYTNNNRRYNKRSSDNTFVVNMFKHENRKIKKVK